MQPLTAILSADSVLLLFQCFVQLGSLLPSNSQDGGFSNITNIAHCSLYQDDTVFSIEHRTEGSQHSNLEKEQFLECCLCSHLPLDDWLKIENSEQEGELNMSLKSLHVCVCLCLSVCIQCYQIITFHLCYVICHENCLTNFAWICALMRKSGCFPFRWDIWYWACTCESECILSLGA